MDNKGVVTFFHSYIAQETEISQWEVLGFFLKLTVQMNKLLHVNHGVRLVSFCSYHMLMRKNVGSIKNII